MDPRPVVDRVAQRLIALHGLQRDRGPNLSIDALARRTREELWSARRRPDEPVLLRSTMVLIGGRAASPLRDVAAPRGVALQMLLVAILAEQCRTPVSRVGGPTPIPVADPAVGGGPCWRYLVAMPSAGRGGTARNPKLSQLDQLRNALDRLETHGRVELDRSRSRGRLDGFVLRDEGVLAGDPGAPYRLPAKDEDVIAVPVTFFTRGWVHALTPDEITVFLFLLALHQHGVDLDEGRAASNEIWARAFDRPRAHLDPYRRLARMGLITASRDEERRQDGTVLDGDAGPGFRPVEEMRFAVHLDRLEHDGVSAAITALEGKRDGHGLDELAPSST